MKLEIAERTVDVEIAEERGELGEIVLGSELFSEGYTFRIKEGFRGEGDFATGSLCLLLLYRFDGKFDGSGRRALSGDNRSRVIGRSGVFLGEFGRV